MSSVKGESDFSPTESETRRTVECFPRGSCEIPEPSASSEAVRSEKARCRNADRHGFGKSDSLVVPEKRANKVGPPTTEESVEERRLTKENDKQLLLVRTQSRFAKLRGLFGVREAKRHVQGTLHMPGRGSSPSKVGAVCGNSARTDLCGGGP